MTLGRLANAGGQWRESHGFRFVCFSLMGLLFLLLSACGFHLKGVGQSQIPFKTVQLVADKGVRADVLRALTQQFQGYGVKVVSSITQAEVQVLLRPTGYAVSKTGVSGQGDTTAELIKFTQPYQVRGVASEQKLLTAQAVSMRDRQIQINQATASDRALQGIQAQMAQEIAAQILDRIGRAMAKQSLSASVPLGVK